MKGYKGFDKDLRCKGFQYEIGKEFELDGEIVICKRGFHFCKELIDIMEFYDTKDGNRFCEIEANGEIVKDNENKKYCTNKIKIIKEIPIEEVLKKVNTGNRNTGDYNTGDYNTGNRNTGDYNTGNRNTGDYNTGNCNTGDYNTGDRNTGNRNTGDYNTGDRNTGSNNTGWNNTGSNNTGWNNTGWNNTGSYNTGSYNTGWNNTGSYNTGSYNTGSNNTGWNNTGSNNTGNYNTGSNNTGNYNSGNYNSGLFNTDEPNARLFNKISNIKMSEIDIGRVNYILNFIDKRDVRLVWKCKEDMTAKEKKRYPEHITTGGALMEEEVKVNVQEEWEKVNQDDKDFIKSLPNFDKDIFYECTGIKV